MIKKDSFQKKFSKLVLSITKRIESFFNFFRDSNFIKKIHPKSLDKKIFIILATIFITIIVYFSLPSFYVKDKVRAQIENQILREFNFKVILDKDLQYGLFPQPHFLIKNVKIEHNSKIISNSKNIKIFISSKNFLKFNRIKIKNLIFVKTNFKIDQSNFEFFFKLLNNDINDQDIKFIKSKLFYLDQSGDIIFLTEIKKLHYLYQDEFLNKIDSKFEIFNLPINLSAEHDAKKNKILQKISLTSLKLNIYNDLNYAENEFKGQLILNLTNKNKTIKYRLINDNLIFNTSDDKQTGEINIKPFFLSSNLSVNEIEIKRFFKDDSMLVNLIKSEIFNNNNFSGKIAIEANNLKDFKHIKETKFDIIFEEGNIFIQNLKTSFKNSVKINIEDTQLIVVDNKIKFVGFIRLDFDDITDFYAHYQINRNFRKNIKNIKFEFLLNLDDQFLEIDNLKVNGKTNQNLEKFLNKFNSKKDDIFNKIIIRNSIKNFLKNF